MSAPNLTPRERAELVAFAQRLERAWANFGCAVVDGDWETARKALAEIGQVHTDATDAGMDERGMHSGIWWRP